MFRSNKRALAVADALAEFCALKDADVEAFRMKHPNFAPARWWGYKYDGYNRPEEHLAWKSVQHDLCAAWNTWSKGERLGPGMFSRLYLAVWDTDPAQRFDESVHPHFATPLELTEEKYGFHKAVSFLNSDPSWRVRVCKCGKRYVAEHPRRRYCSDKCSVLLDVITKRARSERRRGQKRSWWARHRAK